MKRWTIQTIFALLLAGSAALGAEKKIVLLAGELDGHPPGCHEYEKTAQQLQHLLTHLKAAAEKPACEVHFHGWPADAATLNTADTIVLVSAGADRNEKDHPLLAADRMATLEKQMNRGCGLVLLHWSTFLPVREEKRVLEWAGGFFDYETGVPTPQGQRWKSAIATKRWDCTPMSPQHPISRGVKPFPMQQEFYYRLRFAETPGWTPLLSCGDPADPGSVVAWSMERAGGGRGFGCTGAHYDEDWLVPDFRKLVLNAILWTAKIDVPKDGAEAEPVLLAETRGAEVWKSPKPLEPARWPQRDLPVNRERIYDFYAKEADYFAQWPALYDRILPEYPGLDGGTHGHWGNQNEDVWKDGRWNQTDHGSVISTVFRGAGMTIPKAVCVQLGGGLSGVFNPVSATWDAVWKDGFIHFSDVRHGFMDGGFLEGQPIMAARPGRPPLDVTYRGFYRHGTKVIFAYRMGEQELLDSASGEGGRFVRTVERAEAGGALAALTKGGPAQWPQVIETRGIRGDDIGGYAVDTLMLPFDNPSKSLFFVGDHDFFPNGDAALCTIQGEVWTVSGIDDTLEHLRWKRFATGLHLPLGLKIVDGKIHVLGKDQITRLHDLNGDGEADFHECVTNAYETSPANHDFITGLQRDADGAFYFASANQGVCRLKPGEAPEVLATGFRNPNGLGLGPDGTLTTSSQEGEWVPASSVFAIKKGGHYGYGGPKKERPNEPALLFLPRGLDNSCGGSCFVEGDRWGFPAGTMIHLSHGTGTAFAVLRNKVGDTLQGCAVPLPGEFRSGGHRGRFRAADGQLYVSGSGGWGTYTPDDGCLQRLRYTGKPLIFPTEWHPHENGVRLVFPQPLDRATAEKAGAHSAQMWNYRYGRQYGSPEYSTLHPETPGHDPLEVHSAHVLADGRTLFLEIPQLRPANQLHLRLRVGGPAQDLFATVHAQEAAFTDFPGYQPIAKRGTAAAPVLAATDAVADSPFAKGEPGRPIKIDAANGLQFATKRLEVKAGERLSLTFSNPDVVPHNWALIQPAKLPVIGDAVNRLISSPDAAARHYVPDSPDVLAWTAMTNPGRSTTIHFTAPTQSGEYPYLCTFPGHWQVMNGLLVVK